MTPFYSNAHGFALLRIILFLVLSVFRHSVEKMPSVQSFVATSNLPNIWGAVMALGFILISLWLVPHSVMAFIRVCIQQVFPAPLGPSAIMPWRTHWVSYNCRPNASIIKNTCSQQFKSILHWSKGFAYMYNVIMGLSPASWKRKTWH